MRVKIEGDPSRFARHALARHRAHKFRWLALVPAASGPHARIYPQADGWFPLGSDDRRETRQLKYAVLLEPVASESVFVASDVNAIRGHFASGSGLSDSMRRNYLLADRTRSLFSPYPNYSESRYEAISSAPIVDCSPALRTGGNADYPRGNSQAVSQPIPGSLDPRIPALAREITAASPETPYDNSNVGDLKLISAHGSATTLELTATPVKDPLAYFLFTRRAGHCEYFASAILMLRSLGIPARYINGFQTGEFNDVGGDYIVRASDAHGAGGSLFPGYGWIEFDPTPRRRRRKPRTGILDFKILRLVLPATMKTLGGELRFPAPRSRWRKVQRTSASGSLRFAIISNRMHDSLTARMRSCKPVRQARTSVRRFAHNFLTASVAFAMARRSRKIRAPPCGHCAFRCPRELTPRHSLHYSEMLRMLERRGVRKPAATTASEFAASIAQPELAAPVGRMTALYQSARFGSADADTRTATSLLGEIRALLSNIRRKK